MKEGNGKEKLRLEEASFAKMDKYIRKALW